MAQEYDFTGLTQAQQELLTFQGWDMGDAPARTQPSPRTVAKLIARGLLIEHEVRTSAGPFTMKVKEYEVPISVHMSWCAHCALKTRKAKA